MQRTGVQGNDVADTLAKSGTKAPLDAHDNKAIHTYHAYPHYLYSKHL